MKTMLVDAVYCFVSDTGEIFQEMYELLEKYPNKKIIVTNAPIEKFEQYGLNKVPYDVFTLSHNPKKVDPEYFKKLLDQYNLDANDVIYFEHDIDAVKSAQSLGIKSYFYDEKLKDLKKLKEFLDKETT